MNIAPTRVKRLSGSCRMSADIDTRGLDISDEALQTLTSIDSQQCRDEMVSLGTYLESYGDRTPSELLEQQQQVLGALQKEI